MKYRKKPVVIEAIRWEHGSDLRTVAPLLCESADLKIDRVSGKLRIATLEGVMTADVGDWIIRGIKGELYPCKPDIFEATYEPVDK